MKTKRCNKCNIEKDTCLFSIKRASKDGLCSICKDCEKLKSQIYRIENREKRQQSIKNWYQKNKEKVKEKSKNYYQSNKDVIKKRNMDYYFENINHIKETKKVYRDKNSEKLKKFYVEYGKKNRKLLNEKLRERMKNDPLFRTIRYVRNRINSFMKEKNYQKTIKSFELVGCSPQELKKHIESLFTQGMSWELIGKEIHIDHIIPLSSAKSIQDVEKLCHYTNLQPLWAKDNLTKKNKIIGGV
jgi:hypothetical protein